MANIAKLNRAGSNGHGNGNSNGHGAGSKYSILLVDDEPTFQRVATLFLQTHYRNQVEIVGTASSGEEALAQAQLLAPQVVLMDLSMPGLSGLQTIPLLRIMFPEMRVIALTLMDSESYRKAVLAAGGDGLVSKAAIHTDLMPTIRRVMERSGREFEYA